MIIALLFVGLCPIVERYVAKFKRYCISLTDLMALADNQMKFKKFLIHVLLYIDIEITLFVCWVHRPNRAIFPVFIIHILSGFDHLSAAILLICS